MSTLDVAIAYDQVTHFYGEVCAIRSLTLEVPRGEVWAIVGLAGSGKSTALRIAAGLAEPTRGRVRILGSAPSPRNPSIAWLPQGVSFSRALTARDIVTFAACRKGLEPSVEETLATMGIAAAADWRIGLLPQHVVKRLALAIAWMGHPSVLIIDEPTDGLDAEGRALFGRRLERLRGAETVLLAMPMLGLLERVVDHVVELSGGATVGSYPLHPAISERAAPFVTPQPQLRPEAATVVPIEGYDGESVHLL
jgi:ABC-type multidrug transport system ATPase subunit